MVLLLGRRGVKVGFGGGEVRLELCEAGVS